MIQTENLDKLCPVEYRTYLGMLLANEYVRGDIIFMSISLESMLDSFLSGYFVSEDKMGQFEQLILSRMTFSHKIEVLKGFGCNSTLESLSELCKIFVGLNRLRNHAAHASWGDGDKVYKLSENETIRKFVSDYPKSIETMKSRVRRLIAALRRSSIYLGKDFLDEDVVF